MISSRSYVTTVSHGLTRLYIILQNNIKTMRSVDYSVNSACLVIAPGVETWVHTHQVCGVEILTKTGVETVVVDHGFWSVPVVNMTVVVAVTGCW